MARLSYKRNKSVATYKYLIINISILYNILMFYFITIRQRKRDEKKINVNFFYLYIITITRVYRKWYRWRFFIKHVLTSSDLIKNNTTSSHQSYATGH